MGGGERERSEKSMLTVEFQDGSSSLHISNSFFTVSTYMYGSDGFLALLNVLLYYLIEPKECVKLIALVTFKYVTDARLL